MFHPVSIHPIRSHIATMCLAIGLIIAATSQVRAADLTVYKSPWCGCCAGWIEHMEANGHSLDVKDTEDLDPVKQIAGVPEALQSCHTAMVDGYVIEGHVPASDIERLLAERPDAIGLAVPGMPNGSPGMDSPEAGSEPYSVLLFKSDGSTQVYATHE